MEQVKIQYDQYKDNLKKQDQNEEEKEEKKDEKIQQEENFPVLECPLHEGEKIKKICIEKSCDQYMVPCCSECVFEFHSHQIKTIIPFKPLQQELHQKLEDIDTNQKYEYVHKELITQIESISKSFMIAGDQCINFAEKLKKEGQEFSKIYSQEANHVKSKLALQKYLSEPNSVDELHKTFENLKPLLDFNNEQQLQSLQQNLSESSEQLNQTPPARLQHKNSLSIKSPYPDLVIKSEQASISQKTRILTQVEEKLNSLAQQIKLKVQEAQKIKFEDNNMSLNRYICVCGVNIAQSGCFNCNIPPKIPIQMLLQQQEQQPIRPIGYGLQQQQNNNNNFNNNNNNIVPPPPPPPYSSLFQQVERQRQLRNESHFRDIPIRQNINRREGGARLFDSSDSD